MCGKLGPQETKNGKSDYRTSSDPKLIRTSDYQESFPRCTKNRYQKNLISQMRTASLVLVEENSAVFVPDHGVDVALGIGGLGVKAKPRLIR